jgi:VanZ family protein
MAAALQPHSVHSQRATRWLALLVVVLVVHGSLYPWRFAQPASLDAAWAHMMNQPSLWTGLGDVVGNVALFVPVGALGWALLRHGSWPAWQRTLLVVGVGIALAFVLQVAQLWVPARDAALSDVVWNTLGLLLGLLGAIGGSHVPMAWLGARHMRTPLTMVLLWLMLQWWPMVPRLDWQQIKNSLKPLLLRPSWSTASALEAALGLALTGLMLRDLRRRASVLPALVALAAFGKLLMVNQALTLSRLTGWVVGTGLAAALWRMTTRTAVWTGAAIALLWFTIDELRPFEFTDSIGSFYWVPFTALLQGSLSANTLALCWQTFWLGAVMLLMHQQGARTAAVATALSAWALGLELLQLTLPGRVADITPALLPWIFAMALPLLQPLRDNAVAAKPTSVQLNPPRWVP